MVLWLVAGLGLLLSAAALASSRRLSRRLDALTQSYWELRYEYTRLRSQLARLDPEQAGTIPDAVSVTAQAGVEASPSVTFVPLSSIRKKKNNGE
ncbi:MAG: hypothetical protein ABJC51_10210 [Acidobacteriota bacterium]